MSVSTVVTSAKVVLTPQNLVRSARAYWTKHRRRELAYLAFCVLALAAVAGTPARAADPTDAATLITATAAVFTVFAVLLFRPIAGAIVGIARQMAMAAKSAGR
jgi:hypothetical protein